MGEEIVTDMICILCGRVYIGGLCPDCKKRIDDNNERVYLLSLLKETTEYLPVELRERIESILNRRQQ
jgi:hypothetical protein